jgi:hypothetical protein
MQGVREEIIEEENVCKIKDGGGDAQRETS